MLNDSENQMLDAPENYAPLYYTGAKKESVRFRRKLINARTEADFDALRIKLESYTAEEILAAFKEEGSQLLSHAIICGNVSVLNFIVNNIPKEAVKAVFDSKIDYFLEKLLSLEERDQELRPNFSEEEQALLEKFALLFKINFKAVQTYMNSYIENKGYYLTPSIEKVYKAALELHTKEAAHDAQRPSANR